jgi:hypothetical protein
MKCDAWMCWWFVGNKLCEDGKKYGAENTCTSGSTLSKAALSFAKARSLMEKERGNLLKAIGTQVFPSS